MSWINNGDSGSSVRSKLNGIPNDGTNCTAVAPVPLPFVGNAPVNGWTRPALTSFSTWLNQQGASALIAGNIAGSASNGSSVAPGTHFVPGDTISFAGGNQITLSSTKLVSATIVTAGTGGTPGAAQVIGTTGTAGAPSTFNSLFILNVTIGVSGGITSINSIANPGGYTTNPVTLTHEPVADNSSSGITGAVVSIVMGADAGAFSGITVGTPQTNPCAQTASSGSGTGSTWMLYWENRPAVANDGTGGLPLTITFDGGAEDQVNDWDLIGLLKSIGSPPWTATVACVGVANSVGGNSFSIYPLILYNSTDNTAFALNWYDVSGTGLAVHHFTSTATATAPSLIEQIQYLQAPSYFQWFRIQNDGTDLIISTSFEGLIFSEIWRRPVPDTYDKIGFGANRAANGVGETTVGIWNWTD